MLKSIKIHNIALIADCEIEFSDGLNVLSGETGAGKSVVLDSINFVLGQKADKSMILNGESDCSATCVFDISDCPKAVSELAELELGNDDDTVVIKRTFSDSGRGSIKLNGETVTAGMLRRVTKHLVDVHGQSDHFQLLKENEQLNLIDSLDSVEIPRIKSEISEVISKITAIREKLSELGGSDADRAKKLDYLNFSINEIKSSEIYEGEEEKLLEKRKKLQNAEKILSSVSTAYEAISGENGAVDCLSVALRQISSLSSFAREYGELAENLENCMSVLQDVNSVLSENLDEEFDVNEADETEKRLEFISSLKNKYGKNYQAIMQTLQNMVEEYELISSSSEASLKLKSEESKLLDELKSLYLKLSVKRKAEAEKLSEKLVLKLRQLAMKNAQFSVSFSEDYDVRTLNCNGADKIEFLFSANAGEPLKPLSKVISGGELSRLMLAVKSVTGDACDVGTYVFDEIDVGISGVTAQVVAENFADISLSTQIIAISHLPQIVAMSDSSMLIKKIESDGKTRTTVSSLIGQEKTLEVLRLIGGDDSSVHAKAHAEEMVLKAEKFKQSIKDDK